MSILHVTTYENIVKDYIFRRRRTSSKKSDDESSSSGLAAPVQMSVVTNHTLDNTGKAE